MLRPSLAIAIPALGLAWLLAQSDVQQRAAWAASFRDRFGPPRDSFTTPGSRVAYSVQPSPASSPNNPNSFIIYANSGGQFETHMLVAGRELPALVDTGAFAVFLSYNDAASIGIHPTDAEFRYNITTANGASRAAATMLRSIRVGNVEAHNVPALVSMPGALTRGNLLGMTFLNKLGGFDVQSGRLLLRQ